MHACEVWNLPVKSWSVVALSLPRLKQGSLCPVPDFVVENQQSKNVAFFLALVQSFFCLFPKPCTA